MNIFLNQIINFKRNGADGMYEMIYVHKYYIS